MMTTEFERIYDRLCSDLYYEHQQVPTATWQSQEVADRPGMAYTAELRHQTVRFSFTRDREELERVVQPNLPWAEDHFVERVAGKPLNPPPSEAWWPYRVQGNAEHKEIEGEKFSHTYPERIWPRRAGPYREGGGSGMMDMRGIRYRYGDLDDVLNLLVRDPYTRQAFLPIWFPEDTGSVSGQRVPCTLGYHFQVRPLPASHPQSSYYDQAEIVYYIRSCDLFRHFRDDVYMACRLLQWVVGKLRGRGMTHIGPLSLIMHISSLHLFEGDMTLLRNQVINKEDEDLYGSPI